MPLLPFESTRRRNLPLRFALLAVVAGLLAGGACTREAAPTPEEQSGPSGPVKAVLWLEEQVGYVPADIAAKAHQHPRRFVVYSDHRVVYRDDDFHFFRAALSDAEYQQLIDEAKAHSILAKVELPELPHQIADIGVFRMGVDLESTRKEWEFVGGAPFYFRQLQEMARSESMNPDPEQVRVATKLGQLHERWLNYTHPEAQPFDPDHEK